MNKINNSDHSAVESSLGYIFQWKYALLKSIEKLNNGLIFNIAIETLDDVSFEDEEGNLEINQVKHHIKKCKNLTDASTELWGTLKIWFKLISSGIDPNNDFLLITTATASKDSAAYFLKPDNERDVPKAFELLKKTAKNSETRKNMEAYELFKSLSKSKKSELLQLFDNIIVLDESINIYAIEKEMKSQLRLAVTEKNLDTFIEYIEGWWSIRVTKHLQKKDKGEILSEEIRDEIDDLREQFKRNSLPIAKDILRFKADKSHLTKYKGYNFVNQLKIIDVNETRILFAISDYYRAFTQRSRWLKSELIKIADLEDYERILEEEWGRRYAIMCDKLGKYAADEEKIIAAQKLYEWIETGNLPTIRPDCTEGFISRGSYQDLANDKKVGWHPEFLKELKAILEEEYSDEALERAS